MPTKTPAPGFHGGILFEEYTRWGGASQSRLKMMAERTPRRMRYEMLNPKSSSPAQIEGAAIHVAVLQPTIFDHLYPPRPDGHANSNAFKAAVAKIMAANPFATILANELRERILRIAHEVRNHPYASVLLGRNAEQSAVWHDPETGVLCKGRFDDWQSGIALIDLKSTMDASEEAFRKDVADYGYHVQAALYLRGARALNLDTPHFMVVAVEKEPPHDIAIYRIHEGSIQVGDEWLNVMLPRWKEYEASDVWPGYSPKPQDISLPAWEFKRHEQWLERAA